MPWSEDRTARLEGFLRSMDANRNGVLEPSEIPEERKRMITAIAERLGLDAKGSITISEIREAAARRSGPERQGEQNAAKPAENPTPLVPGFGVEQETAKVPAFGERVDYASLATSGSSSKSPSAQSASSGGEGGGESRVRYFAEAMFRRYDRDRSGVLEKEEWGGLRSAEAADRNHDGKITPDELAARLAEYSGRRSGASGEGPSESESNGSSATDSDNRKSYRFLTPAERLPKGLPDWFARNDANGDGQVAMAEFSSSWSDAKVSEFDRFDLNRDGLITPRECLDADKASADAAGPVAAPKGGPERGPLGSTNAAAPPQASGDQDESTPWWMQ